MYVFKPWPRKRVAEWPQSRLYLRASLQPQAQTRFRTHRTPEEAQREVDGPAECLRSSNYVPLILFILAVAVVILTAVVSSGGNNVQVRVTPTDIEQLSGGFLWRFFHWGIVQGSKDTGLMLHLNFNWGIPFGTARFLDVTNPTPFAIALALVGLSLITKLAHRPSENRRTSLIWILLISLAVMLAVVALSALTMESLPRA